MKNSHKELTSILGAIITVNKCLQDLEKELKLAKKELRFMERKINKKLKMTKNIDQEELIHTLARRVWHGAKVKEIKGLVENVKDINQPLPEDSYLFPGMNAYMISSRFYGNNSVTKFLRSLGGESIK